jgi:hypothetical protein
MPRCSDGPCGHWWQDEDEDYPRCHYPEDDPFPAPCEYDDEPVEEEVEDRYTLDDLGPNWW